MTKKKKYPEKVEGSFLGFPHRVLDSRAYLNLHHATKCLLIELARQLNGSNNGHLQLTYSWLKTRGWGSNDTVSRGISELLSSGLIVKTRQGGLNIGPCQYAVTWLPISNFSGLEMRPIDFPRGKWTQWESLAIAESKKIAGPSIGPINSDNRTMRPSS